MRVKFWRKGKARHAQIVLVNVTLSAKPEIRITCNAARGGPSHGHRQHEQGIIVLEMCERTDTLIAVLRTHYGGANQKRTQVLLKSKSRSRVLLASVVAAADQTEPLPGSRLDCCVDR